MVFCVVFVQLLYLAVHRKQSINIKIVLRDMVKIEFFLKTKKKREEVKQFYESLGLRSVVQKRHLKLQSTEQTRIVSVTQSRISLRAQNHREILENHKEDLLYDLETSPLEEDVETEHAHRSHHIPFRIKLKDPLSNTICISPALEAKTIGILTSGGDAPGMNSVIWATTKAAIKNGAKVLGVYNGYSGLLTNEIKEITEEQAYRHMHLGGTFLGSTRSKEFMTPEGLQTAISNIKQNGIDAMVIIGGDGTMKGAGKLAENCQEITTIFIPASIDNDIPGTESLGAATALHRIIESIDCIESTMQSHKRGFVLEVMGRDCGWLALCAAFSTEAAHVFIPEYPVTAEWKESLIRSVRKQKEQHCTYIILAEGAKHIDGRKLAAEEIIEVLKQINIDSRSVVLGHTQRGGSPCATDRLIAPTLGVTAAEVALSKPGAYAIYINTTEKVLDLFSCIDRCSKISNYVREGKIAKVRGKEFIEMYKASICDFPVSPAMTPYGTPIMTALDIVQSPRPTNKIINSTNTQKHIPISILNTTKPLDTSINTTNTLNTPSETTTSSSMDLTNNSTPENKQPKNSQSMEIQSMTSETNITEANITESIPDTKLSSKEYLTDGLTTIQPANILIATIGSVGAGANMIINKILRHSSDYNKTVINMSNHPYFQKRSKTKRAETDNTTLKEIFSTNSIDSIILIGGLDAISEAKRISVYCKNIYIIPCTISNNVPGTTVSIGSDTALDTITALCDNLKINSPNTTSHLVEVHGGACGYLSIATAVAIGAIDCYFPEEICIIKRLYRSIRYLNKYFNKHTFPQLIIKGNGAMKGVCNETIAKIIETDGAGTYTVKHSSLGHVQKGNKPTAIDRLRISKVALFSLSHSPKGTEILGLNNYSPITTPLSEVIYLINEEKRRLKRAVWLEMARTYRVLQ
ncbi:6-phosphofructokinase 1 [Nematocida sp. AWRm80]|nr:6-phosphofructokinase 1 [Nematocida sp. AWRm80]